MENAGKLTTIDELDPENNYIDTDNFAKFLSDDFDHTFMDRSRSKGPDYFVIDNFAQTFNDLEKADLINARSEALTHTSYGCDEEEDLELARCDNLTWI